MLTSTAHVIDALDEIRERITQALAGERRYSLAEVDDDLASLIARHQIAGYADPSVYDWAAAGDFDVLGVDEAELEAITEMAGRLAG
jgi:hypothetical protein